MPHATFDDLAARIEDLRLTQPRTVVAISGYGGSGKSTLAKALAVIVKGGTRLRGDNFLDPVRSHRRSADWDGVERTRMRHAVLEPFRRGESVRFRPYDWNAGGLGPLVELPATEVLVVDAIGILHPELE